MALDDSPRPMLVIAFAALLLGGCSAYKWLGIRLFYDEAPVASRVLRDLPYRADSESEHHKLDLFPAAGSGWPVVIFVPGGGWTEGSKDLVISGADVYANIGRFYAHRGIGVALINYRLQPAVTWREQVGDVAAAVAWIRSNIAGYGGNPEALFLSGHSAGAQLATYTALDASVLSPLGFDHDVLCGVIPVSGLAFDLADGETGGRGAMRSYYEKRFRAGDPGDGWLREASAITYLTPASPPFLLLHGSRERKALSRQNRLLFQALRAAGVESELRIAKQTHRTMVLALASEEKLPAQAVLEFVRGSSCGDRRVH